LERIETTRRAIKARAEPIYANDRREQSRQFCYIILIARTDSTDSRTIWCFYSAQRLDLFAWCVRL